MCAEKTAITPAMIEAGAYVLKGEFGGTGCRPSLDFDDLAAEVFRAMEAARIVVTDEMVTAGASALSTFDRRFGGEREIVEDIYRAMAVLSPSTVAISQK